jgi:glycosyltransferase involved in cell wall biosynthesis
VRSIVHLGASGELGGAERSLLDQAIAVRAADPLCRVTVVAPREGGLSRRAAGEGFAVRVVPIGAALEGIGEASYGRGPGRAGLMLRLAAGAPAAAASLSRLRRALAEIAPAVVHSHGVKSHLLAAAALPRGAALAWHLHDFLAGRPVSVRLLRWAVPRVAAVLAVSGAVARDALQRLGVEPRVLHNAVDLEAFSPAGPALDLDRAAGLPPAAPGTVRVGLVATLGLWKGHEVFLRALARLPASPPVRGYVVGGSIYRTTGSEVTPAALRELARSLGLEGRVGFAGFVDDPGAAMRALDVVVHASTAPEPFGLVVAEGMACGRAVVTTAGGGTAEIVADGSDVLVVGPGEVEALASAVARLAAYPALRDRLGAAARRTAVRRFDRARVGSELAELYRRLAEGGDG